MSARRDQMHVLAECDEAISAGFQRGDQFGHDGGGRREFVEGKDVGVDSVLFTLLDLP